MGWESPYHSLNNCAAEIGDISQDVMSTLSYASGWAGCNNPLYPVAGYDTTRLCITQASATFGYAAKAMGTTGKAMSFCFVSSRWGPCTAFSGYAFAHLGSTLLDIMQSIDFCSNSSALKSPQDCFDSMANIFFDAAQSFYYFMIADDYCFIAAQAQTVEDEGITVADLCTATDEEIAAFAEANGVDANDYDLAALCQ